MIPLDPESQRLAEDAARQANWKRWGPYLAERQWGTVREDYSPDGACWNYFTHDQSRSRAYRWGEDGLLGITDRECRLCFALALWNGRDPILKERIFGLTNPEGNHGEDVKEQYFYLDATPTSSYLKGLYKYPQAEFPYESLVAENSRRTRDDPEYEILDTGAFDESRYFDVLAEYAKAGPDDICIRLTLSNRGPRSATLHLLPTLWFRNTWSWGCLHEGCWAKPWIVRDDDASNSALIAHHATLDDFRIDFETLGANPPELLFTDNETNLVRLYGAADNGRHTKDAFHDYLVGKHGEAVSLKPVGTKCAAVYRLELPAGGEQVVRMRLCRADQARADPLGNRFDRTFATRIAESNQFYNERTPDALTDDEKRIMRQAYAGLLWSRQFYEYIIPPWLEGDPAMPPPPPERKHGRNSDWPHLFNRDIISMPDKWEYPWYAAWDLAFHMIPLARVDGESAKQQLILLLREWYMHPSGQLPAYEFALDDVNPPVHAWAVFRVYKMTGQRGQRDRLFLARCFQKLLINFTWWVNRKDPTGRHIFAGGFLGLDNIGVFDRSKSLGDGRSLAQADGTAWMAFFCTTMLAMALELAEEDPSYEDVASKFFEHFVAIVDAMNDLGGCGLWDENDGFYYDQLLTDDHSTALKLRSIVGLIPLLAVEVLESRVIDRLGGFSKRMHWFLENRPDLARHIAFHRADSSGGNGAAHAAGRYLLAVPSRERLERVLRHMLDESQFLSPYGLRSLSRHYEQHPFEFTLDGQTHRVKYVPAESETTMFGGNSNWRGPVWFPLNFLLTEALERYHHFYGDDFKIECPTGSGHRLTLAQISHELAARQTRLFTQAPNGRRPCHGDDPRFATDPHWRNLLLFHEYFDPETGRGCGASHQTGWTALVIRDLEFVGHQRSTGSTSDQVVQTQQTIAQVHHRQPPAPQEH